MREHWGEDFAELIGEFGNRYSGHQRERDQPNRDFGEKVARTARWRGSGQARGDPRGQSPLDEQRRDLTHAEVALVALALAHRPFAVHQQPVDRTPMTPGALEIRVHVGRDFRGRQSTFGLATERVRPDRAVLGETGEFRRVHMRGGVEDARTSAMLVQWTVAQGVKHRSGPPAAQQAQGVQPVRDQGDQVDLQADHFCFQSLFAGRRLDGLREFWQRDDVAIDVAAGNERAQERARIIG